nr:zinc finger BED domain-containing protein RICESLEEPER 2-like [Ipomoea batatas]
MRDCERYRPIEVAEREETERGRVPTAESTRGETAARPGRGGRREDGSGEREDLEAAVERDYGPGGRGRLTQGDVSHGAAPAEHADAPPPPPRVAGHAVHDVRPGRDFQHVRPQGVRAVSRHNNRRLRLVLRPGRPTSRSTARRRPTSPSPSPSSRASSRRIIIRFLLLLVRGIRVVGDRWLQASAVVGVQSPSRSGHTSSRPLRLAVQQSSVSALRRVCFSTPARSGHLGEGNKETTTAPPRLRLTNVLHGRFEGSSDDSSSNIFLFVAMESSNPNEQTQVHDIREYDLDEADFNDDNDECENVDNLDVNCVGVGNENLDVGDVRDALYDLFYEYVESDNMKNRKGSFSMPHGELSVTSTCSTSKGKVVLSGLSLYDKYLDSVEDATPNKSELDIYLEEGIYRCQDVLGSRIFTRHYVSGMSNLYPVMLPNSAFYRNEKTLTQSTKGSFFAGPLD